MVTATLLCLSGCAVQPERTEASALDCARAVVDALPQGLDDLEKHCLASAGIAQRCGRAEAWVAGWGKELQDAFGAGDASRRDLHANRLGRQCAVADGAAADLLECCRRALAEQAE